MTADQIDVSGLVPSARDTVRRVAAVYLEHVRPHFLGLVAHGSAVKGGFVPGCSDIDLQLYLADEGLTWAGHPPLAVGLAVRRALGDLDPAPFRYVQCYVHPPRAVAGEVGPIPGAYHVVAGRLPVPAATADELRASAARALATLQPATFVLGELFGPGSERLARDVRLLCTKVWPVLYQVLVLCGEDPLAVWGLPKELAIDRMPRGPLRTTIVRFHAAVRAHYPDEATLGGALDVIETGAAFLEAARAWRNT